jgi:hypothetical protein
MSYRDQPQRSDSIAFCVRKPGLAILALLIGGISAFASDICGPANLSTGTVKSLSTDGDLALEEGPVLRLAGLQLPPTVDLAPLRAGQPVAYGMLTDMRDRWSRYPAVVFALQPGGLPIWIQQKLVAEGKALIRPEANLGACWGLLKAVEAAAVKHLQPTLPEAGRFARIEGRVGRVGEGRSAWFVNVFDRTGKRVTGVVQKRHMRRIKDGGVDVNALQGQIIRLRGVRSIRNTGVIQVTLADQIEILR